ncbi:MAG: condensation domain-containing protein, partial [Verrucomicrobia bacterium]|nr:condensation domain-containing protein [Verrucomicrobiota bacterium]
LLHKRAISLKPSKYSFRQYDLGLDEWLAQGNEKRITDHWEKLLRNIKPIAYPFLKNRTPKNVHWNIFDHYRFHPEWNDRIKRFSDAHSTSTFVIFSTIIKLLVGRYTNNLDSYYATSTDARTGSCQAQIVGDFANLLLVRNRLKKSRTFFEQLEVDKQALYSSLDNKVFAINRLKSQLDNPTHPTDQPFRQLQIVKGPDTGDSLNLDGIINTSLPRKKVNFQSRIGFVFRKTEDRMELTLSYAPDMFVAHGMERFIHNFQWFVRLVLETPNIKFNQLPDLSNPSAYRKPISNSEFKESFLRPL